MPELDYRPMDGLLRGFSHGLRSRMGATAVSGSRIEWPAANGRGFVTVDPTPATTIHGRHVMATITVVQRIDAGSAREVRQIARSLSAQTALGMIVPGSSSPASVDIVSRLRIGRSEMSELSAYERILIAAALSHRALASSCIPGGSPCTVPVQDEACRWTPNDFLDLAVQLRDASINGVFGPNYVRAQLPSTLRGVPGIPANPDIQLNVQSDCRHPCLGNGLIASIGLTTTYKGTALSALANRLNRIELASFTTPPIFGSWLASHGSSRVRYFTFWPNFSHVPGLHFHVCAMLLRRTESLHTILRRAEMLRHRRGDLEYAYGQDLAGPH